MGKDTTDFLYETTKHEPGASPDYVLPLFAQKVCLYLPASIPFYNEVQKQRLEEDIRLCLLSAINASGALL